MASHAYQQVRVGCVGEEDELAGRILSQEILARPCRSIQQEPLDVGHVLLVCIIEAGRPHLLGLVLLDAQYLVLVVVVGVVARQVVLAVGQDDQYLVVIEELTQVGAMLVVVQAFHVRVEPHLASSQRTRTVALQLDAQHVVSAQYVAH